MKQLHVKLDEKTYKDFHLVCIKNGKTMSDVIREYVDYILRTYYK